MFYQPMYVFTKPLRNRNDVTVIQFLTGVNSKFSFFYTGCLTKAKEGSDKSAFLS